MKWDFSEGTGISTEWDECVDECFGNFTTGKDRVEIEWRAGFFWW